MRTHTHHENAEKFGKVHHPRLVAVNHVEKFVGVRRRSDANLLPESLLRTDGEEKQGERERIGAFEVRQKSELLSNMTK